MLCTLFRQAAFHPTTCQCTSGVLLVNMIPLICSYGEVNDLLRPFRHLRNGKGLGSLLCLKGTDEPSTQDPGENNLAEFQLLWSDILA